MSGSPRTAIGRTWWQATAPHALVWPDHRDRAARLNTAIRVALDSPERPVVHRGDATAELAAIIATIPAHAHLVLYHCAVLAHMPDTTQAAFTSGVLACSTDRPISWVQAEPRTDGDVRRLRLLTCHDGRVVHERALASYQPHGQWLTWTHLL